MHRVPTRCSLAASQPLSSHYITSCLPISEPGTPARRRAAAASAERGSGAPAPACEVAWDFFRQMLEALPWGSSLGLGISGKAGSAPARGSGRAEPRLAAPCPLRSLGFEGTVWPWCCWRGGPFTALSLVPQNRTREGQPGSGDDPAGTVQGDTVGYKARTGLKFTAWAGRGPAGQGMANQGR